MHCFISDLFCSKSPQQICTDPVLCDHCFGAYVYKTKNGRTVAWVSKKVLVTDPTPGLLASHLYRVILHISLGIEKRQKKLASYVWLELNSFQYQIVVIFENMVFIVGINLSSIFILYIVEELCFSWFFPCLVPQSIVLLDHLWCLTEPLVLHLHRCWVSDAWNLIEHRVVSWVSVSNWFAVIFC